MAALSVIELGIDPTIELGPITLAWHGITIALGIVIGGLATARYARERGLDLERLSTLGLLLVVCGMVGARLLYLIESGDIADPGEWLGTRGFSLNGGVVAVALAIAVYVRRADLSLRYLDAVAVGFALGLGVGRVGDVINGEHYGPPSDFFLAVRNSHPDAETPGPHGRLPLRRSLRGSARPGDIRAPLAASPPVSPHDDAPVGGGGPLRRRTLRRVLLPPRQRELALGLSGPQWTSILLLVVAGLGALWARSRYRTKEVGLMEGAAPRSPRTSDSWVARATKSS